MSLFLLLNPKEFLFSDFADTGALRKQEGHYKKKKKEYGEPEWIDPMPSLLAKVQHAEQLKQMEEEELLVLQMLLDDEIQ